MADPIEHPQALGSCDPSVSGEADSVALAQPAPIGASERLESIDVLRGFALLGILPINILSLALPGMAFFNPTVAGGFSGGNFAAWYLSYLLFEEKMMTIFSMLFGAGLVLMTDRVQQRKRSPAAFFYRRAAILLVIGLAHAYLLWPGDILVTYALCGMLVYPLRKLSPRLLMLIGLLVTLPALVMSRYEGAFLGEARESAMRVQVADQQGNVPSEADQHLAQEWEDARKTFHPTTAEIDEELEQDWHASYWQSAARRAEGALSVETQFFGTNLVWTVSGRMLIGMALMNLGVFSGSRPLRFYVKFALLGYGLGLPIVALGASRLVEHDFDVVYMLGGGTELNEFGSLLVALGHVGAISSLYKAGLTPLLMRCLAAVGRMALTNYLMQTLLCTTLFYGYGFGLRGTLDRVQLLGVVAAIWTLQLSYSPLWLRYFRFGPVEWLWRSLTYGQAQPMRKSR
jgi:uncharacterized protein